MMYGLIGAAINFMLRSPVCNKTFLTALQLYHRACGTRLTQRRGGE